VYRKGGIGQEPVPRAGGPARLIVSIDNPPRLNAMTRQMLADLGRLWDELEREDRGYMPVRHWRARFYGGAQMELRCGVLADSGAILAFCREPLAQGAGAARLTLAKGLPRTTTGKMHKPSLARELAFRTKVRTRRTEGSAGLRESRSRRPSQGRLRLRRSMRSHRRS